MEALLQDNSPHPLKDTLVCYQDMPFRWRKLDSAPGEAELLRIYSDNQRLMEVILSCDDTPLDSEQAMDKDGAKEIKRLEAKINLLLGWVGMVLQQQQQLPPSQEIVLSANGLKFFTDAQLSLNDQLMVELFIEPHYPQAFVVPATVIEVNSDNAGDTEVKNVMVRFADASEMNQQWLDKYVFRLHRRQVAFSRKRQQGL